MMTNIKLIPEVKPDRELKVKDILRFVNPPDRFHSPSLFCLRLLAEYGPLRGGKIWGGANMDRAITVHEMKLILDNYKTETDGIIFQLRKEGCKGEFIHPMNHQLIPMLEKYLRCLPKARLNYKDEPFTAETTIDFTDLSTAIEQFYPQLVKMCMRTKDKRIAL